MSDIGNGVRCQMVCIIIICSNKFQYIVDHPSYEDQPTCLLGILVGDHIFKHQIMALSLNILSNALIMAFTNDF